ncbi:MAG: hypothetical protein FJ385_00355 [Verrucomicrobia bacterium]|nr:hypothetical protein [Verrucomicrobiota bacterium]
MARRTSSAIRWSAASSRPTSTIGGEGGGRLVIGYWLLVIGYWLLEKRKKCAEPGSVGILPAPHGVSPGV